MVVVVSAGREVYLLNIQAHAGFIHSYTAVQILVIVTSDQILSK